MAMTTTTRLEAVNTMLSVIGESPVNTLSGSRTADAVIAEMVLDEMIREVETKGWHFNTERDVELVPDTDNRINLGANFVRVDLEAENAGTKDVVQRGSLLYDKKERSYDFTATLKATVVYLLDWDDIPQSAKRYILIRAARVFQDRMVGSEKHHRFTKMDEMEALIDLKEFEGDTADYSIFDNWSVYRIVNRADILRRMS